MDRNIYIREIHKCMNLGGICKGGMDKCVSQAYLIRCTRLYLNSMYRTKNKISYLLAFLYPSAASLFPFFPF